MKDVYLCLTEQETFLNHFSENERKPNTEGGWEHINTSKWVVGKKESDFVIITITEVCV